MNQNKGYPGGAQRRNNSRCHYGVWIAARVSQSERCQHSRGVPRLSRLSLTAFGSRLLDLEGNNQDHEERRQMSPPTAGAKLTIWGRANSVNVQKILWCCEELNLNFDRIDAGLHFGRTKEPEYLALNPNARVPTLVDGNFILWESNAILRYLAQKYGADSQLYPKDLCDRAIVDKWMDWTLSTYAPIERDLYWSLIRTESDMRDRAAELRIADQLAELWRMLGSDLQQRKYIGGAAFSVADICLGAYARRWFGFEGLKRPAMPALEVWFSQVSDRAGFTHHLSARMT
jgi:glutathione S-transferase